MEKIIIVLFFFVSSSFAFSQSEIVKVKDKHFLGDWFSVENALNCSDQSILVFYRIPPQELKDSIKTNFKIRKDDVRIIFDKQGKIDTTYTLWAYVKESRNLKITLPINTGSKMYYSQYNTGKGIGSVRQTGDIYLLMTATFHLESLTEEKMVLKYTVLKK